MPFTYSEARSGAQATQCRVTQSPAPTHARAGGDAPKKAEYATLAALNVAESNVGSKRVITAALARVSDVEDGVCSARSSARNEGKVRYRHHKSTDLSAR